MAWAPPLLFSALPELSPRATAPSALIAVQDSLLKLRLPLALLASLVPSQMQCECASFFLSFCKSEVQKKSMGVERKRGARRGC